MKKINYKRSLLAFATLGVLLLSNLGFTTSPTPSAAAELIPTDYGIYNLTITPDAPEGFAIGGEGTITFNTFPLPPGSDSQHPMVVTAGETLIRTLTMPDGLELTGAFAGATTCPGTGKGYDEQGIHVTDIVCSVISNQNDTHTYRSEISYVYSNPDEGGRGYRITQPLYSSTRVKLTGPIPADSKIRVDQTLASDYTSTDDANLSGSAPIKIDTVDVTFDSAGGSPVAAVTGLTRGAPVAKPSDPTRVGYSFKGWFDGNQAWAFADPIQTSLTLVARWDHLVDLGNTAVTNYEVSTGNQTVGSGAHTVTVRLADKLGNPVTQQATALSATTETTLGSGAISSFTETKTAGTYSSQITSSVAGGKVIRVTYNAAAVGRAGTAPNLANVTAQFVAGAVDLTSSSTSYEVTTGKQLINSGKHTITVKLADRYGNPTSGEASKIKSTATNRLGKGKVTAFTQSKTAGTYLATVSSTVTGNKVISATYNGKAIPSKKNTTAVFYTSTGGENPDPTLCTPKRAVAVFADTPITHKFYKEIDWMQCMKYSTGWRQPNGLPLYKPQDNLSREAMAAFIFRMEAPTNYKAPSVSPFADVHPGDVFYREISWMHKSGLSTGWAEPSGKPTYRPKDKLTREAMAAFIYRLEAPEGYKAPKVSPLRDMAPGMKFYTAISWMYSEGLTTGNKVGNAKEFWPKDELSRQAMAAFIYRLVLEYRK